MATTLLPVAVPVPSWFHDHRFDGRTILAAVEAMRLLSTATAAAWPAAPPQVVLDAGFTRFLEIAPDAAVLEVLVRLAETAPGVVRAGLLSRVRVKTMARVVDHCELTLAAAPTGVTEEIWPAEPPAGQVALEVTAERIYRELVPFGPAYRTLCDRLRLTADLAWGRVLAPDLPRTDGDPGPLGNPFPLDGAMHAACVHGQRLVDFVPFPVGFAARTVVLPTASGETYDVQVRLRSRTDDELVYDLTISDGEGRLRESVTALRMRDVSGGTIRPPAWIKAA